LRVRALLVDIETFDEATGAVDERCGVITADFLQAGNSASKKVRTKTPSSGEDAVSSSKSVQQVVALSASKVLQKLAVASTVFAALACMASKDPFDTICAQAKNTLKSVNSTGGGFVFLQLQL
jgi:hypothetical protein